MKKHLGFILFFTAIIFIFLSKLIFIKETFLNGDYLVQFFPWSKIYSEAIKNFTFPFWVGDINSGFPLVAEGQVGAFYPLNIILFFLLPFNAAYNYSIIIHFILAGIFIYIYARKLGADEWGGALSALVFCFGSGYAGCFYNIITLRTLAWFPLGLFIIEKYFDTRKLRFCLYLGIILGIQLLAGFAQMAVYSALFYMVYFFYGLWIQKNLKIKDIAKIAIAFIVAAILFFPQLILSLKMIGLSTRAQGSLGFSLWGSFNPLNLISLCFPKIIIYGSQFYIGIFTLIFFILAIRASKRELKLKPVFMIFLVSFFFALGAYNPFYVLFIKMTHFYGFRNPSKFIFFSVFAAAVLSGWGFTRFFKTKDVKEKIHALRASALFISVNMLILVLLTVITRLFKEKILEIGKWYVTNHIFGKEFHRYGLQTYFSKIDALYNQLVSITSLSNGFVLISLSLCVLAVFLSVYLIRHKDAARFYRVFFMAGILFDLFIFSFYGTGFRGNIKPFSSLKITHNKILDIIKFDKDTFRIMPFALASKNMPWWIRPCANILVDVETIASYSPLVQQSYKESLSSLEVIDNSLGVIYPEKQSIGDKQELLRVLNVKYIIASEELNFDFIEKVIFEDGIWLYKLKACLPRIFFTADISDSYKKPGKTRYLDVLNYKDGFCEVELSSDIDGFLVFSENNYPGWTACVDGVRVPILKVKDVIQAVKLCAGKHNVIFEYRPYNVSEK